MKKIVIFSGALLMSLSVMVMSSCSNSQKSKDAQGKTLSEQEYAAMYEDAITFTIGELTKEDKPGVGFFLMTLPLTIVNNTDIDFSPADYIITYEYVTEDTVDGDLVDVTLNGSMSGPILPAKSPTETSIVQGGGFDLKNPNVKLTISQEEFERRYKEVQNK